MEKLDLRLSTAAEFVNEGTVVADIGTDHGYLICYLVEEGICNRGYATDINEMPLESAKNLIFSMGLEGKIETRLTDGLNGLPEKEIEEILICGMGGETIISILDNHEWIKTERVHLVLQPMSRADMLRKWLYENGWKIDEERAVEVDGHLYTVMSSYYFGESELPDELYCLVGELLKNNDEASIKYVRWQAKIQRSIAEGLLRSSNNKNSAFQRMTIADMLDEQADEMEHYND